MERRRIELPTCTLRTYRSPKLSYRPKSLLSIVPESRGIHCMCRRPPCQKGVRPVQTGQIPILPTSFLLTRCRTFVTFLPSSNSKERYMRFLAIAVIVAGVLCGCRHDYNPTPPPYYCQPAGGCTPACAPACNNPCAPSTTPYLSPTPATIPRSPYNGGPAAGTYAPAASGSYVAPAPGGGTYVAPPPGSAGYAAPATSLSPATSGGR